MQTRRQTAALRQSLEERHLEKPIQVVGPKADDVHGKMRDGSSNLLARRPINNNMIYCQFDSLFSAKALVSSFRPIFRPR